MIADFEPAVLARATPSWFAHLSSRIVADDGSETYHWLPAKHLAVIDDALVRCVEEGNQRILIEAPPRHGKTVLVSRAGPAWMIGNQPDWRVGLATYGDTFSKEHGQAARDLLREYGPEWFGIRIRDDSTAKDDWKVAGHRGGMFCVGVGGGITGRGFNVLIIDDPVKNAEEADSEVYREKVWRWARMVAFTRVQPGGSIVLVMARWHEDDLAGRVLNEFGDWTHIRMPAFCEDPAIDPTGRELGEPLWPEGGWDTVALEQRRREVGSRDFNALYQCRPSAPEGSILKRSWWRYYDQLPCYDRERGRPRPDAVIASWDAAFEGDDDSDYVVGQVWHRYGADLYLVAQTRGQMDYPDTKRAIRRQLEVEDEERYPISAVVIEKKANGHAIIQELRQEITGVIAQPVKESKESRARAASAAVEAGNVYLPNPRSAPWVDGFVDECANFPRGRNDDQVDAFTQAVDRLRLKTFTTLKSSPAQRGGSTLRPQRKGILT